jgi:hypothetical protein
VDVVSPLTRYAIAGTLSSVVDDNNLPDIIKSLRSLEGYETEIGVFGESGARRISHSTPITMEQLGVILHEGCRIKVTDKMRRYLTSLGLEVPDGLQYIHIPSRPFLDTSMPQIEEVVMREVVNAIDAAIDVRSPTAGAQLAQRLGSLIQKLLRQVTVDWTEPPNHPWTIYLKGTDNPLEDSGRLQEAIVFAVTRK